MADTLPCLDADLVDKQTNMLVNMVKMQVVKVGRARAEQQTVRHKCITWLECETIISNGMQLIEICNEKLRKLGKEDAVPSRYATWVATIGAQLCAPH